MYMKRMVEVGKAENGYVIECHVGFKEQESESKNEIASYRGSCDKQYIAKDLAEVNRLLTILLPMLDAEYSSEDEFDASFEKLIK